MDYFDDMEQKIDINYNEHMFDKARDFEKFEDTLRDMILDECKKLTKLRTQYLKVMTNFISHNGTDITNVVDKYEKQAIVVRTLRKVYNLIKRS